MVDMLSSHSALPERRKTGSQNERAARFRAVLSSVFATILTLLFLLAAALLAFSLRLPAGSGTVEGPTGTSPGLFVSQLFTEAKSSALDGLSFVKKVYRLPADTVVAPEPDRSLFRDTADSAEVAQIVADAAELLDGQETFWNEDIAIRHDTVIHCYRDESILGISWQERMNGRKLTFLEVKVSDASQFRRKLAENTYGSTIQEFPRELAAECNAVMASSADFYRYQKAGVHVYNGTLYRWDGLETLDTCFVDGNGDLLFVPHGTLRSREECEQYIKDHNISFSLCFGPIVIEDGVNVTPADRDNYPLGEYAGAYPRTIISQLGELHYLVVIFFDYIKLSQAVDMLVERGLTHSYTLDGGQSGTIVSNNEHVSPYQYGHARPQSDIIYFATALPEGFGDKLRSDPTVSGG